MKLAAKILLVILFIALGAKFPVIQDPSYSFSFVGGAFLGGIAILALELGRVISKRQESKIIPSKLQSILLWVTLTCYLLSLLSFTIFLYTNIEIFKNAIFVFVFIGSSTGIIASSVAMLKK